VRSTDGDDGDTGLTWALAKATLAGALAVAAAGETIYVSQAHAETQASTMTLTIAGTTSAPVYIICANDAAEPPTALATTATVTTTGAYTINFTGFAYIYGITFSAGTGGTSCNLVVGSAVAAQGFYFDSCSLRNGTTSAVSTMYLGNSASTSNKDQRIEFNNCSFQFGHVGQKLQPRNAIVVMKNISFILGSAPTTLFLPILGNSVDVTVSGSDLSNLGSTNLVDQSITAPGTVRFQNCKLGFGAVIATGTNPGWGGVRVLLDNCDSADTNYRLAHHKYQGVVTSAINCFLTAAYSMKMVSTTSSLFVSPLVSPPIAKWNAITGSSKTATVEIIGTSSLNDDEIWLEIEYLSMSGFPLSSFANDKLAWFGTPAAQTASTAAWTEDLVNQTAQKLVVTFTPQEAGYVIGRVHLAKPSTTIYVDPFLTIG